jgi:hypothetical protein
MAERLARKSPCEEGDSREEGSIQIFDVGEVKDARPPSRKMALAEGIELAEGEGSESCPTCGESKSSNSGKKVKMGWFSITHALFEHRSDVAE